MCTAFVSVVIPIWPDNNHSLLVRTRTSAKNKLCNVCISDLGISLLQKKSLEKEELCQRLKEQLDALEKETASKLSEMDSFNNELKVIIFYYIHF